MLRPLVDGDRMENQPEESESYILKRFQLDGIKETGEELGRGSYAKVVSVLYRGLKCAAKKLHQVLRNSDGDILERFERECLLLSDLRHPHIVQFLGVYSERGSDLPVLVMEYLPATLAGFLERHGVLPDEISYSILQDVAFGMIFLHEHTPPIIHRDLSANNILLTSGMTAKVSDLGVAKILNFTPAEMTQTPGTQAYMPPEAMVASPEYNRKIDIFSFGILILHTLCGRCPLPTRPAVDPLTLKGVSEVDRRQCYLSEIGCTHTLVSLISQCLANNPVDRPEMAQVLHRVTTCLPDKCNFENKVEMLQQFQNEKDALNSQIQQLLTQLKGREREIESNDLIHSNQVKLLSSQVRELRAENVKMKDTVAIAEDILKAKNRELELRLKAKDEVVKAKLSAKDEQLVARSKELAAKFKVEAKDLQAKLEAKDKELQVALQTKDKESCEKLQARELVFAAKLTATDAKAAAIQEACDQQLLVKQQEISLKESIIEGQSASLHAKNETIQSQTHQLNQLQEFVAKSPTPALFHPCAKLEWKQLCNLPIKLLFPQAVAVGDEVYVGGLITEGKNGKDATYIIFNYSSLRNEWNVVATPPVLMGGLAAFSGKLVSVGGRRRNEVSNAVHVFDDKLRKWKESIPRLHKHRMLPSCASYHSLLVACGGVYIRQASGHEQPVRSIEIFSSKTKEWFMMGDLLPTDFAFSSNVVLNNCCYFLGAFTSQKEGPLRFQKSILCLSLPSAHDDQDISHNVVLKAISNTPHLGSVAAKLGWGLLALGGVTVSLASGSQEEKTEKETKMIHVYCPLTTSWIPSGTTIISVLGPSSAVAQVSDTQLLIIDTENCHVFKVTLLIEHAL